MWGPGAVCAGHHTGGGYDGGQHGLKPPEDQGPHLQAEPGP